MSSGLNGAGNRAVPYTNTPLLPTVSHAGQYLDPPGNHQGLPNYLWMAVRTNFGIIK